MREFYEEVRNLGSGHTPSVGSTIITNLAGIFSADRTLANVVKSAESFAVSGRYRARRNFDSTTATGYPSVS